MPSVATGLIVPDCRLRAEAGAARAGAHRLAHRVDVMERRLAWHDTRLALPCPAAQARVEQRAAAQLEALVGEWARMRVRATGNPGDEVGAAEAISNLRAWGGWGNDVVLAGDLRIAVWALAALAMVEAGGTWVEERGVACGVRLRRGVGRADG
jgi:hypothetical protein